jgi:hypothetical protein
MVNKNLNLGVDIKRVQQLVSNSAINLNRLTIDPINADQQARYKSEGLTYISNNISIIPRDSAGNISLEENSNSNPLLIIDPVTELITTKSALRVLDTRFQYYKFPVTIRPGADVEDLVVDLDFESDTIAARYTIPAGIDDQGQPVTYQRIATSYSDDWFTNGGENTAGRSRLPFVGGSQAEIGSYTITPDVLEALRAKNKTLKFTIQAQFNASDNRTTGFTLTLARSMPEEWRSDGLLYELYSESNGDFGENDYPFFQLEYVVDIIGDAAPYDKYYIEVSSGNRSWVLVDNCFWKIDVIDIPTTPSLTGTIGHGAYFFGGKTTLREIAEVTEFDPDLLREVTRVKTVDIFTKDETGQLIKLPEQTFDNSAVSSSNPTGNVSEDIDETYPPFGFAGSYDGEGRTFQASDYANIDYRWSGADQKWIQE